MSHDSAADVNASLFPPIRSPQVTSSEATQILASQENVSDTELLCMADTMLSLGTEVPAFEVSLCRNFCQIVLQLIVFLISDFLFMHVPQQIIVFDM